MAQVQTGVADVSASREGSTVGKSGGEVNAGESCVNPRYSRHAVFEDCPQCGGEMAPEHAHFRCRGCGWRDSCCD